MFSDQFADLAFMEDTLVVTHGLAKCARQPSCCIHKPSRHHMLPWPQAWVPTRSQVFRRCPHGWLHPDPDALSYALRTTKPKQVMKVFLHPCDGCCQVDVSNYETPALEPGGWSEDG